MVISISNRALTLKNNHFFSFIHLQDANPSYLLFNCLLVALFIHYSSRENSVCTTLRVTCFAIPTSVEHILFWWSIDNKFEVNFCLRFCRRGICVCLKCCWIQRIVCLFGIWAGKFCFRHFVAGRGVIISAVCQIGYDVIQLTVFTTISNQFYLVIPRDTESDMITVISIVVMIYQFRISQLFRCRN